MAGPMETPEEQKKALTKLMQKVEERHIFLDPRIPFKEDKPERILLINSLREVDVIICRSLIHLCHNGELLDVYEQIIAKGASVKFEGHPLSSASKKVWAMMPSWKIIQKEYDTVKGAKGRSSWRRNSGGRKAGIAKMWRAQICYDVAKEYKRTRETNEFVKAVINSRLENREDWFGPGDYWKKQARDYAYIIGDHIDPVVWDHVVERDLPLRMSEKRREQLHSKRLEYSRRLKEARKRKK